MSELNTKRRNYPKWTGEEKRGKKTISELWEHVKQPNIYVFWVPWRRGKRETKIYENTMAKFDKKTINP